MVKNIIFDVGEVLLEYRWKDMLVKDYGCSPKTALEIGDIVFHDSLWKEFDLGNLSQKEVIAAYEIKYSRYAKEIKWFIEHGELMHVQRPDVWELLHQLKEKGYKIYLLSNYSKEFFAKHTQNAVFLEYIDGKVISYQVNMVKPEICIYEYLLEKYDIKATESVFFDDRKENTAAAIALGIKAHTIKSKEELKALIKEYL